MEVNIKTIKKMMRKETIYILLIFLLLSCNKHKNETSDIFYFGLYNGENTKIRGDIFTIKKKKLNLFDSICVFKNGNKVLTFREIYAKNEGISRFIRDKKTLTHSSNDTLTLVTNYYTNYAPFVNKESTLIDKRIYRIKGKSYKIFHYSEFQNAHKSFDSYYLENVGFICYYNFSSDRYILCDSTNIRNLNIKDITGKLIYDKEFFAHFTGAKVLPNYYRPKDNSKEL